MPNLYLEDVDDAYSFFVMLLGIDEQIFWKSDFSFLLSVTKNKDSYDSFISWEQYKRNKRIRKN